MKYRKKIRAYDGESVDIRVRDPKPTEAELAAKRPAARPFDEDALRTGRTAIRVYDLGTFSAKAQRADAAHDGYFEIPLEGPVVLGTDDHARNRRRLLEEYRFRVTLVSGEEVPSCYPLQVDEETANANVVVELAGPRGSIIRGLSIGSDKWLAPEPVADQRETIARLRSAVLPQSDTTGLDTWEEKLDQRESRRWLPAVAGRVDREGELRMRTAPQAADIRFRSVWQYEPWSLRDRHRYQVCQGDRIGERPIDPPPALRLTLAQCTRVDVFAAPQLHDVRFEWIDLYMVIAGWWIVIIPIPTVRIMTLRSAQFPHTFIAPGTPEQDVTVGVTMSERIARTQRFAEAVEARIFSPTFRFLASVQGRFGVYQRPYDPEVLCAALDYRWPNGQVDSLKVFRRVTILRERTLLHVGPLYVPGIVYPWVPNFSIPPFYDDGTGTIEDGF